MNAPISRRSFVSTILLAAASAKGRQSPTSAASEPAATGPVAHAPAAPPRFDATSDYGVRAMEGWRVLVSKHLIEKHAKTGAEALELLHFQLYQIVRRLPAAAVGKLREVPIWVELHEGHHPCMVFHPDVEWLRDHEMNPDKAGCVEIADARIFLQWTIVQPWMVLHELAHAYHKKVLADGFENTDVDAAYHRAMDAKLYDSVQYIKGDTVRAYAATNPEEFFAESTESYFGTNDFYPFVRSELKQHDPITFAMMGKLWGDL